MSDTGTMASAARRGLVPGLTLLVAVLAIVSLAAGPVRLAPTDIVAALLGRGDEAIRTIVMEIRLPRAILALAIGGILGLSGAAMQGLLRNPLAAPSLFGAPQSAAFAAVATISLGLNDALSWGCRSPPSAAPSSRSSCWSRSPAAMPACCSSSCRALPYRASPVPARRSP